MSNSPHSCPLCPITTDDRDQLFTHLLISHRKSEIVSGFLAEQSDRSHEGSSSPPQPNELVHPDQ